MEVCGQLRPEEIKSNCQQAGRPATRFCRNGRNQAQPWMKRRSAKPYPGCGS